MGSSLWVSLSGAIAQLREIDVVANNVANADTVGFKRERLAFESALETAVADLGVGRAAGAPGRVFAAQAPGGIDMTAGAIQRTGGDLDVAIAGDGFFEVQTPNGTRYTRAGAFALSPDGTLVTQNGDAVLGEGGPIGAGDGRLVIRANGDVVDGDETPVGTLRLVRFEDPNALEPEGANLLRPREGALPLDAERVELVEGALERSNVQPVAELAGLVLLQRAFETSMRAIQSDDETTQRLIEEMS
ncbi:MAG: flagellar basal-body rod protein FlgF [Proteobacteria bacterium]|nr:MAG: flagellar basal-body rod protein FlgF [Pseudomonadota bacterium]